MHKILKESLDKLDNLNIRYYQAEKFDDYITIFFPVIEDFINFCKDNNIQNVFYTPSKNDSDRFEFLLFTFWNSQPVAYIFDKNHIDVQDHNKEKAVNEVMNNIFVDENLEYTRPNYEIERDKARKQLQDLLNNKDQLEKELSTFLLEKSPIKKGKKQISYYENIIHFFRYKDIDTRFIYGTNEYDMIREIYNEISIELQKKVDDEYMNRIYSYVDSCVAKYKKNGRITTGEVDLFFAENNIVGTNTIKNIFKTKVNEMIQSNDYEKSSSVNTEKNNEAESPVKYLKWI